MNTDVKLLYRMFNNTNYNWTIYGSDPLTICGTYGRIKRCKVKVGPA